jgi:hypothetical protein
VPLVAPAGTLQTLSVQQSLDWVQVPPSGWHAAAHVPTVAPYGVLQIPEQH